MTDQARRLLELETELWRRECRADLHAFAVHVLRPDRRVPAKHHRLIIDLLMGVSHGAIPQLILSAPPGSGKSTYVSYLFAAWYLAHCPGAQVLACAHTEQLAASNSLAVQRIAVEHADVLGYTLISDAAGDWRISNGGRYRAVGVGTAVTGFRATMILIDDPVKGIEAAHSATDRDRVADWYFNDIRRRRTPGTATVLVQTRWHEDDLSGRLLRLEPDGWRNIRLAAIAEDDDPFRLPGEPLWDDDAYGYGRDLLAQHEVAQRNGQTAMWQALYQGSPTAPEGNLFKPHKMPIRDFVPGRVFQTMRAWDLASSIRGDWTVGIKLACTYDEQFETVLTITDVQRFRGAPEEVHSQVLTIAKADGHGCTIALPEDPGQAGQSQVADFTRMLRGYVVMPIRLTGSKEIRALATASQANIGRIGMLKAPWNAALIDELQSFPSGRHDDQVDALSLGHDLMMGKMASLAVWARM